eukprot:gb/GECG01006589.1/.p1 GENE.gb/GECG01006589.1/~~gb/GECG01006589.1/.p1  ORF type:complete len:324 (+),score=31.96 gb/GECG01006589.1/:1-972(+)
MEGEEGLIEISTYAEPSGKWTIFVSNLPETMQESGLAAIIEPLNIPHKSLKILDSPCIATNCVYPQQEDTKGLQAVISFFTRADARTARRYLEGLLVKDSELRTRYCVKQNGFSAKTTNKQLRTDRIRPFSLIEINAPEEIMPLAHLSRMTNYLLGYNQWHASLEYAHYPRANVVPDGLFRDKQPDKFRTPGVYDGTDDLIFPFERESNRLELCNLLEETSSSGEPIMQVLAAVTFPAYDVVVRGIGLAKASEFDETAKERPLGGPSIRRRAYYRAISEALRHIGYVVESDWTQSSKTVTPVILRDSNFKPHAELCSDNTSTT